MVRPFRQQIEDGILDRAAALFAQRGFAKTSVQDVADAVGLSKAGLLHHYPSKDALRGAVSAQAATLGQRVLDHLSELPPGAERDWRAVEHLVDVALAHPGMVALMLAPVTGSPADDDGAATDAGADAALRVFGVDPHTTAPARLVRVLGALSALAVLSLAAHREDRTTEWRPLIVATCTDALGHPARGVPSPRTPDRLES